MNRGVLGSLRALCPPRKLTHGEALRVAELQASRLLAMNGIARGAVPSSLITDIPKVQVKRMEPWPVSGCTDWAKGSWVIVVNAGEPELRQRFTLAHEFKHIIDYPFIDVAYPKSLGVSSHDRAEAVCDYFAGCLLVPRQWLKAAWVSGMQDPARLARYFQVSLPAMRTRLGQTGLSERQARCPDVGRGWRYLRESGSSASSLSSDWQYLRTFDPAVNGKGQWLGESLEVMQAAGVSAEMSLPVERTLEPELEAVAL